MPANVWRKASHHAGPARDLDTKRTPERTNVAFGLLPAPSHHAHHSASGWLWIARSRNLVQCNDWIFEDCSWDASHDRVRKVDHFFRSERRRLYSQQDIDLLGIDRRGRVYVYDFVLFGKFLDYRLLRLSLEGSHVCTSHQLGVCFDNPKFFASGFGHRCQRSSKLVFDRHARFEERDHDFLQTTSKGRSQKYWLIGIGAAFANAYHLRHDAVLLFSQLFLVAGWCDRIVDTNLH